MNIFGIILLSIGTIMISEIAEDDTKYIALIGACLISVGSILTKIKYKVRGV